MLKRLRSECLIQLTIATEGPLLIKSGLAFESGVDMTPVRTWRNGRWEVYIPGSSLKGVLRGQGERITRTLAPNGHGCCDPFKKEAVASEPLVARACSERLKEKRDREGGELDAKAVYRDACPICKLFGCLFMAGRLSFNDAYSTSPVAVMPQQRSSVGIDRHTGGASKGSLFDLEVVTGTSFATTVYLRNFELWQLGLLAFLLRDLQNGDIKLGMGKSRGLGRVKGTLNQLKIRYLGLNPAPSAGVPCELQGMRCLEPTETAYGFWEHEQTVSPLYDPGNPPANPVLAAPDNYGLRTVYRFDGVQSEQLWHRVAPLWVRYARENRYAVTAGN